MWVVVSESGGGGYKQQQPAARIANFLKQFSPVPFDDEKGRRLQAEAHCAGLDMQLPAIGNDLENRVIRGDCFFATQTKQCGMRSGARVKWDAWIRNLYVDRKWSRDKLFGRYSTCARQMFIGYEKDIMQKSISEFF